MRKLSYDLRFISKKVCFQLKIVRRTFQLRVNARTTAKLVRPEEYSPNIQEQFLTEK